MADWTKRTYTIKGIDANNAVTVIFDCDNSTQVLQTVDTSSADILKSQISDYLDAYCAGKQWEAANAPVKPPTDVTALIGKVQTADTEA